MVVPPPEAFPFELRKVPLLRSVARPERVELARRTLPANTRWNTVPWGGGTT
jgi:hypothetical protein